jgi:hypothetical protein
MRLFINIVKWATVTIGAILLALLTLSFLLRNRVADIFLAAVNSTISTKVEIGGYNLSLIKKFPKAAVELRNVTVLSSHGFDKSQFSTINTDTLLTARSAFLEFGMIDILRGNYTIQRIALAGGRLNLYSDSSGGVNYDISAGGSGAQGDELVLNLERINVSDLKMHYVNRATSLDILGSVETGRFKSRIAGNELDFICNTSLTIRNFELFSLSMKTNASVNIDLDLHQSDSGIIFRKGNISLEDFRFGLTGQIDSSDMMDLRITGQNIQLARIKKYLPEKYAETFSEYSPAGLLRSECRITGLVTRKQNPEIDLTFSLEKGSVLYGRSRISLKDLGFSGSFSNGCLKSPETFRIKVDDYHFRIGSAVWSGNFDLSDFTRPEIKTTFSGDIIPSELIEFIPMPGIRETGGSFRLNISLSGIVRKKEKYDLNDLIALNPEADIRFNSFSVADRNDRFTIGDVDGNLMMAKNVWAEDLYFTYLGQRFRVNGEFRDLPSWLAGKPVTLKAIADISADNLNPSLLFPDSASAEADKKKATWLPSGVEADINFRTTNLTWDAFHAESITGTFHYIPGRIDLLSLRINALDGTSEGNISMVQNGSGSFVTRENLTFENIDIKQAFKSFRNFGQDFIVAENLAGSLSGKLTLLMPLDSLFHPVGKDVTAEGKYILVNGALIGFEPLKELSDYIELSELENVTFSRVENELYIRDKYVAVPQMEIRSSAADFTVSGKHYFDDSYEYHVRTYLSVLLSKKASKNSRNSDEFGAIEEDGLGRTSIFLKITGLDEDIKVAYDLKAAGNNVKQSLKKEKGNLKTILNQEYGWFRKDSTIIQDNTTRPKYRITFPETDTTANVKDTIPAEKDRRINRIFKKKFNQSPTN